MSEFVFIIGMAIKIGTYLLEGPVLQGNPIITTLEDLAKLIGQLLIKHHPTGAGQQVGSDLVNAVNQLQNPQPNVGGADPAAASKEGLGG